MLCVSDRDQLRIDLRSHSDLQPEHNDSISGCLKPQDSSSGEERVQEGREEVDEDTLNEVSEDISTNLDDTEEDVLTASGQQEEAEEEEEGPQEAEEEGLQEAEEEGLLHKRQDLSFLHQSMSDLALEEHSDSDDSEMDEEEELCELVQRLRNELSLYTATGFAVIFLEYLIVLSIISCISTMQQMLLRYVNTLFKINMYFCFLSVRVGQSAERKANDGSRGSQRFCFSSCHFCKDHQFDMMTAKRTSPYLQYTSQFPSLIPSHG